MIVREIRTNSKSISSIHQPRQPGLVAHSYAGGCGSQAILVHHTARTPLPGSPPRLAHGEGLLVEVSEREDQGEAMMCNQTNMKGKCVPRAVSQTGSLRGQVKGERSRSGS